MATARTPLGRLDQPNDIGDVVAFLCSDAGRWVTGQTIAVERSNSASPRDSAARLLEPLNRF